MQPSQNVLQSAMRMTPARLQLRTFARCRVEQARLSTFRSTRTNLRLTRREHTFVRRRACVCQASYSVVKEPMLRAWRSFNLLLFYERASRQAPDNKKPGVERRASPSLCTYFRRDGFARCSTSFLSGIRNRPHSESFAGPESLKVTTLIETRLAETLRPTRKYSSIFASVKSRIEWVVGAAREILTFSSGRPDRSLRVLTKLADSGRTVGRRSQGWGRAR